jgi:ATP-dependent DNA helicase PIF1
LLNDLREGVVSPESEILLRELSRELEYDDGIQPTELFPHRVSAEAANRKKMDRLSGETETFTANDTAGNGKSVDERLRAILDRMAPTDIKLAVSLFLVSDFQVLSVFLQVGAQVMCTKVCPPALLLLRALVFTKMQNITPTVVNGSIGVVTGFSSRLEPKSIKSRDTRKVSSKSSEKWPKVQFNNGEIMIMNPVAFEYQNEAGTVEARRRQVCAILSWVQSYCD